MGKAPRTSCRRKRILQRLRTAARTPPPPPSRFSRRASGTRRRICGAARCTCSPGSWPARQQAARYCSRARRSWTNCAGSARPANPRRPSCGGSRKSSRNTWRSRVTRRAAKRAVTGSALSYVSSLYFHARAHPGLSCCDVSAGPMLEVREGVAPGAISQQDFRRIGAGRRRSGGGAGIPFLLRQPRGVGAHRPICRDPGGGGGGARLRAIRGAGGREPAPVRQRVAAARALALRAGARAADSLPPARVHRRDLVAGRARRLRERERTSGPGSRQARARGATVGWVVVVSQREDVALRPAALVRRYTLFWVAVSLLLVLTLGAILSRRVTEPVKQLQEGVQALRLGRTRAAEVDSDDEIGELARSFNQMAGEIVRRDEEIRRWNSELRQRVDERTAELKTAQDQILRARRLAALGSLGAGMAHELNNPITAISGVAALLRKELAGTPHEERLRTLHEQALRVSTIVGNLRAFADQERTQPGRRFPLHSSVLAALDLYEEQMRAHGIELATELKSCDAQGDPAQMQEAIAHIVQNAISAMPQGGTLKVTLSDVNGDALKLSVSDTGKGIPAGMRDRIFDPFFTTKEGPGAVGMGLSISHSIVEAHHGKLLVDSAEGHGATFTIVLPAAAAAAHLR